MVGWMAALMAGVLLLPLLGFDDGSRPELNWVRWSLMFGPLLWFLVFEHAPFLLLGSWIAVMMTTPLSWLLEESPPSPRPPHVAILALLALGTIVFAITSGEGLRYTIPMGASLCVVSSMLDLRHATSSRQ